MWRSLIRTSDDPSLLLLRVLLAVVIFPHGAQKALGWFGGQGLSGTIAVMTQEGMPPLVSMLVIGAEFLGSIGLLVGLLSRVAAAGIALVMLGAIFLVHLPNGFFMNWTGQQSGEGFEYHILVLAITAALMIKGSGSFSLDHALSRRVVEPQPSTGASRRPDRS